MKFLKLLDPLDVREGSSITVGMQQLSAREKFPELVGRSNLRFGKPGMEIPQNGTRLLLGLAASFSLYDLRLADVVNEAIDTRKIDTCVDVFDISNINAVHELSKYYPEIVQNVSTPVVGLWKDGTFERLVTGHAAILLVFDTIGIEGEPAVVLGNLTPPSRSLVED